MEHSLELATSAGDFQTQAKANRQIGWILWDYRRETDKSRKYYQRSLEIATAHGLLKELGAVHGDLGYLQNQWGDSQAAEESCRTAIAIREALGDQHGLASAYLNLGLVFQSQKAYVEENRCYEQSLDIYRRLKVPSGEAEVLLHQGIAWREQEQLIESEKTLQKVLALEESHDLSLTRGDVLYQMGRTVLLSGRKEEARSWLTGAVEQANTMKSPRAAEYTEFLQNYIDLLRLPDHGLN